MAEERSAVGIERWVRVCSHCGSDQIGVHLDGKYQCATCDGDPAVPTMLRLAPARLVEVETREAFGKALLGPAVIDLICQELDSGEEWESGVTDHTALGEEIWDRTERAIQRAIQLAEQEAMA